MKLRDIPLDDIFAAKNWTVQVASKDDVANPPVVEAADFKTGDTALFSAVAKLADGSEHPTLSLKIFDDNGHHPLQTFVFTKLGWVDAMSEGFFRAVGKYAHDVFPFDVYLARPWAGDTEVGENAEQHRKVFSEAVPRMKVLRYDTRTTTRRWPFDQAAATPPASGQSS